MEHKASSALLRSHVRLTTLAVNASDELIEICLPQSRQERFRCWPIPEDYWTTDGDLDRLEMVLLPVSVFWPLLLSNTYYPV